MCTSVVREQSGGEVDCPLRCTILCRRLIKGSAKQLKPYLPFSPSWPRPEIRFSPSIGYEIRRKDDICQAHLQPGVAARPQVAASEP